MWLYPTSIPIPNQWDSSSAPQPPPAPIPGAPRPAPRSPSARGALGAQVSLPTHCGRPAPVGHAHPIKKKREKKDSEGCFSPTRAGMGVSRGSPQPLTFSPGEPRSPGSPCGVGRGGNEPPVTPTAWTPLWGRGHLPVCQGGRGDPRCPAKKELLRGGRGSAAPLPPTHPTRTLSPGRPGGPGSPLAPFAPSSPGSPGSPCGGKKLRSRAQRETPQAGVPQRDAEHPVRVFCYLFALLPCSSEPRIHLRGGEGPSGPAPTTPARKKGFGKVLLLVPGVQEGPARRERGGGSAGAAESQEGTEGMAGGGQRHSPARRGHPWSLVLLGHPAGEGTG